MDVLSTGAQAQSSNFNILFVFTIVSECQVLD